MIIGMTIIVPNEASPRPLRRTLSGSSGTSVASAFDESTSASLARDRSPQLPRRSVDAFGLGHSRDAAPRLPGRYLDEDLSC